VRQRCPGYYCEQAFTKRLGGFAIYPKKKNYRKITLTCGGCCGRTLHRKLTLLKLTLAKKEGLDKDQIMVHLSSCITKDNYHAPPCPHLDYIKALIAKIGIDVCEDTVISEKSEQRRATGICSDGGK